MGTFRSGVDNIQLHHWSNAKPAQVRSDQPEAQMIARGRPKKLASGTDSSNSSASAPSVSSPKPSSPIEGQSSTDGSGTLKPKPATKINKLPERRSARLAARSHATSIAAIQLPSVNGPPRAKPFSAGNSNVAGTKTWSASAEDIQNLNTQINRRTFGAK